ncbi:MAG TPA: hypothetical protein VFE05_01995 [Longimicrobiaceae bacterium]|jgi:hypothetical protein|nr:hypothetical protein [Longimicrobiaceae bacterium]
MHIRLPRQLAAVLLGSAVLLSACSDATGADGVGSMQFDYAGDLSGSFSAVGKPERGTTGSYAEALYYASPNLNVAGYQTSGNGVGDMLSLTFVRPTGPHTYQIRNDAACPDAAGECAFGAFIRESVGQPPVWLMFTSGTVTVTSVTSTEISGTFSGTVREEVSGLAPHPAPLMSATITHGRFRAPLVELRLSSTANAAAIRLRRSAPASAPPVP